MAKTVKKNAGRYSRRKTKKRSAAAYERITGTRYKRKTVKRSSRSKQVKRNPPTLRKITKSTGWMAGPPGTGTQVKFKNNKGKREVYIRRKPLAKKGKR